MAEEQTQGSPLIDPEKIKPVVQAVDVDVSGPAPAPARPSKPTAADLKPGQYCWGTGRRKSAIARVRVRYGQGKMLVNGRTVEEYFPGLHDRKVVCEPLKATETEGKFDVFVKVEGGGSSGQSGAVVLGLARALMIAEPTCFAKLRDGGYLTRDGRMKERKKYGQKGARKRFQFSKR